jgi:hypothetical protein
MNKDFKVKNAKGEYLSFTLNTNKGTMEPLWGPIAMSYTFTESDAWEIVDRLLEAEIAVPKAEWEAEQKAALDAIFGKKHR